MAQNVTYEQGTPAEDASVFNQALQLFNKEPQFAHLAKDMIVNVQLKDLGAGVNGAHYLDNGDVAISPGQGKYRNNVGDYLNVLTHEFTHAAEKRSDKGLVERVDRTNPAKVAIDAGVNPKKVNNDLVSSGIYYGDHEPVAWLVSNMTRGAQINRDIPVLKFIESNPEFSAEFFRRNAQPNRPVGSHKKGEPEMSLAEKVLYKLTGYAPNVTLDIPPWTKQDIARMNALQSQSAQQSSNKGNK